MKHFIRLSQHAPTPPVRSRRARTIVRWFGLVYPRLAAVAQAQSEELSHLVPWPGQIVLITGPSGAGKSSLLRALRGVVSSDVDWIDLNRVEPPDRPLVDCFGLKCPLEEALSLLARVGLSEAWTYLRTPEELSDGQRWRLRLALAMWKAQNEPKIQQNPLLVADEFAALLDRVTAAVVAHALRRSVSASIASAAARAPLRAIVATSHDDLIDALEPDVHVYCDFGSARIDVLNAS
jgi:ABC-type ATPase with predicted acetyltransferase domain